ncbi:proteasome endopeptidase complex, archaeal, alpha subunit [Candidatus Micrarchaeota archaeon CG10_big_fil_rev_8_21_14_0_10_59_7]|nr:MAG: proteasome endopeptidase complex, archaeal, alpha subunit [Candidatus Micrarchaeota archaeon CG10_big_fil_rev_8_21_14_0_10_59_7]
MYPPSQAAYDRAITVFSPDGRLFQVEYAREAVRTGSTSVGVVCKDGLVLLAHKRITSPLAVSISHEKIYLIDEHIAAASSGLVADARKLVDFARLETQKHRLTFNEEMPIEVIAKHVGDHVQFFTQYAGVRPYGVSLLVGGADKDGSLHLFETDPSGALFEYKATAIGSGKKTVEEFFEKEYKESIPTQEGIKLAIRALRKATNDKLTPELVDIAVVDRTKKSRILSREEIAGCLEKG